MREVDAACDGWCHVEVAPQGDQDLRDATTRKANEKSWTVREISHRKPNLEDYYLQLFQEGNNKKQKATA
ncbi:MAG: hypothetical protein R3C45_10510 [Phycisphaerales bacterium]